MQVPALFLVGAADPLPVNVRIHTKFEELGGSQAPAYSAKAEAAVPTIIFHRAQVDRPARGGVISVQVGEAYRIDRILPPDDEFVSAHVVRLSASETVGLPVPEDSDPYIPAIPGHPGMAVAGYLHTQTVASDEWVVDHMLGYQPVVAVSDEAGEELEASVTHVSLNQCLIHFAAPQTGTARCV